MAKEKLSEKKKWLHFRDNWMLTQKLVCGYCGRDDLVSDAPVDPKGKGAHVFKRIKGLSPEQIATVDHIYPQAKGGERYDEDNLVVCCQTCNQMKRDFPLQDWFDHMKQVLSYSDDSPKPNRSSRQIYVDRDSKPFWKLWGRK